jgi:streptomycin 6-kinase
VSVAARTGRASVVPEHFAQMIEIREGEAGEAWVADLPAKVAELSERWSLRVDGESRYGYVGIVVPVVGADGEPAALKVSYPDGDSAGEAPALAAWGGDGSARLLARDEAGFALLIERLDPDRSLFGVPVDEGVAEIGRLLARLHRHGAPDGVASLRETSEELLRTVPDDWAAYCGDLDRRLLEAALSTWRELGPYADDRLLHGDLHYGNVLAGTREPWLVIDPKGVAGDPAYDVIPAIWNRLDALLATTQPQAAVRWRVDALCEAADIDRGMAYRWTLARAVANLMWQLRTGHEGPGGEILIAEALLPLC